MFIHHIFLFTLACSMVASVPEEPYNPFGAALSDSSTASSNWLSRLFGHGQEITTIAPSAVDESDVIDSQSLDASNSTDGSSEASQDLSAMGEESVDSEDATTESSSSLMNIFRARRAAQVSNGVDTSLKTMYMPGSGLGMPQGSSTYSPELNTTDAAESSTQGLMKSLQGLVSGESKTTSTAVPQGLVGRRRRSISRRKRSTEEDETVSSTQAPCKHHAHHGSGAQILGGILPGNGSSDGSPNVLSQSQGTQDPSMVLPQRLIRRRRSHSEGRPSFLGTPSIMPVEPLNESLNETSSEEESSSTVSSTPLI
jgi:hypothetical protein